MRLVDQLIDETSTLVVRAQELQLIGYHDIEVGSIARDGAAVWERTLKASDPTLGSTLNSMANELAGRGWPHASALHVLRQAANSDKHDSSPTHDLDAIEAALEELKGGGQSLAHVLPSVLNALPDRLRRRRMVCAIYEFFHAGETQYSS